MRQLLLVLVLALCAAPAASAQSLFVLQGERAVEGSAGWSSGPFANGLELHGAASLDGRWDVGFGVNRYSVDLGGDDNTVFNEWTVFARYFLFKEDDDATPVSFAAHAQLFSDNYEGDDSGWYVLTGAQLFKKLTLADVLALYPFVGFSLASESATFGGDTERAIYLTRLFGVHGQITLGDNAWIRVTADEHAFRRETYRAVRAAYVRRF
jgi:hypothetical protein